jgi:hypothetical protein
MVISATGVNITATSLGGGYDNEGDLVVSAFVGGLTRRARSGRCSCGPTLRSAAAAAWQPPPAP